jgi:poly-gamma-glutamate synthase PgsB/CapB
MTTTGISIVLLILVTCAVFAHWRLSVNRHQRRLDQLHVRIHVNGIRGKSSVTRLVAGVLREGGFVTVAKTTGSAARVIGPHGEEQPIKRRGAATINEQIDIVRDHVTESVEALVIECMAVRPLYQRYSQDFIVRSDITIITNVREDHQEEMGETLEEIADSMSVTIPGDGVLITAENRPHLLERLRRNAEARGSRFIHADPGGVLDEDLHGFDYLQFKDNVATGFAVADLLNIDRRTALRGMCKAVPDVGVVRLQTYDVRGKKVLWVPMFAANDRESVIATFELLQAHFPGDATVVGILNNRADRGRRAELFAAMVPHDLSGHLDHVITFGAYEETVTPAMVAGGYPADRIHNLGETRSPGLTEILDTIAGLIEGEHGVLVGMVNIHTDQAEMLIEHFAELRGGAHDEELEASRAPERLPMGSQRVRRAGARSRRAERPGGQPVLLGTEHSGA